MALDWGHCELDHCGPGGRAGRAGAGAGQVTPAGASSSGPHGVRGQGNAAGTDVTEDPASRISFFFLRIVFVVWILFCVRRGCLVIGSEGRARSRARAASEGRGANVFFWK